MKLIKAEYLNTGGNCYVLFGELYANVGGMMEDIHFAGSVDCEDRPRMDFYETAQSAYECNPDAQDFLMTAYPDEDDFVMEIWKEAFCFCITHTTSRYDALVACDDLNKVLTYHATMYDNE